MVQRLAPVLLVVAALLLLSSTGRAQNLTVDTGDEIVTLAELPSLATSPASETVDSPAGAAAAASSIPVLQLGQTAENRVTLVRQSSLLIFLEVMSRKAVFAEMRTRLF